MSVWELALRGGLAWSYPYLIRTTQAHSRVVLVQPAIAPGGDNIATNFDARTRLYRRNIDVGQLLRNPATPTATAHLPSESTALPSSNFVNGLVPSTSSPWLDPGEDGPSEEAIADELLGDDWSGYDSGADPDDPVLSEPTLTPASYRPALVCADQFALCVNLAQAGLCVGPTATQVALSCPASCAACPGATGLGTTATVTPMLTATLPASPLATTAAPPPTSLPPTSPPTSPPHAGPTDPAAPQWTTPNVCNDAIDLCGFLASAGLCCDGRVETLMIANCPMSCDRCPCYDQIEVCGELAARGLCDGESAQARLMLQNCPVSCSACHSTACTSSQPSSPAELLQTTGSSDTTLRDVSTTAAGTTSVATPASRSWPAVSTPTSSSHLPSATSGVSPATVASTRMSLTTFFGTPTAVSTLPASLSAGASTGEVTTELPVSATIVEPELTTPRPLSTPLATFSSPTVLPTAQVEDVENVLGSGGDYSGEGLTETLPPTPPPSVGPSVRAEEDDEFDDVLGSGGDHSGDGSGDGSVEDPTETPTPSTRRTTDSPAESPAATTDASELCAAHPCANGGECIERPGSSRDTRAAGEINVAIVSRGTADVDDGVVCICPHGFVGALCEQEVTTLATITFPPPTVVTTTFPPPTAAQTTYPPPTVVQTSSPATTTSVASSVDFSTVSPPNTASTSSPAEVSTTSEVTGSSSVSTPMEVTPTPTPRATLPATATVTTMTATSSPSQNRTATPPPPDNSAPGCVDSDNLCPYWASAGDFCNDVSGVWTACLLSCGRCPTAAPTDAGITDIDLPLDVEFSTVDQPELIAAVEDAVDRLGINVRSQVRVITLREGSTIANVDFTHSEHVATVERAIEDGMFYVTYHNTTLSVLRPTTATPARGDCTDLNELCPFWASQGTATPSLFCLDPLEAGSVRCPLSCGRCTARTTGSPEHETQLTTTGSRSTMSLPVIMSTSSPVLPVSTTFSSTSGTSSNSPSSTPSSSSSRSSPVPITTFPSTLTTIVATQPYTPPVRCNGVDFGTVYFQIGDNMLSPVETAVFGVLVAQLANDLIDATDADNGDTPSARAVTCAWVAAVEISEDELGFSTILSATLRNDGTADVCPFSRVLQDSVERGGFGVTNLAAYMYRPLIMCHVDTTTMPETMPELDDPGCFCEPNPCQNGGACFDNYVTCANGSVIGPGSGADDLEEDDASGSGSGHELDGLYDGSGSGESYVAAAIRLRGCDCPVGFSGEFCEEDAAYSGSCVARCGQASFGLCFCDHRCLVHNDCCFDFTDVCDRNTPPTTTTQTHSTTTQTSSTFTSMTSTTRTSTVTTVTAVPCSEGFSDLRIRGSSSQVSASVAGFVPHWFLPDPSNANLQTSSILLPAMGHPTTVTAFLENDVSASLTIETAARPAVLLTAIRTSNTVYFDDRRVVFFFQALDDTLQATHVGARGVQVAVQIPDGTGSIISVLTANCSRGTRDGLCSAELIVPEAVFLPHDHSSASVALAVSYGFADAPRDQWQAMPVISLATKPSVLQQRTIFADLPARTLHPGEEFEVPVFSRFIQPLRGYTVEFVGSASVEVMDVELPTVDGAPVFQGSVGIASSRLSATIASIRIGTPHQSRFAEDGGEDVGEMLFVARCRVRNRRFQYMYSTTDLSIRLTDASDTDGMVLYPMPGVFAATIRSRHGVSVNGMAPLHIGTVPTMGIFAFAENQDLVNTAAISGVQVQSRISTKAVRHLSPNVPALSCLEDVSSQAICSNQVSAVLSLDGCTIVLDGSETDGSAASRVLVAFEELAVSVWFRIFVPRLPVSLHTIDSSLESISGWLETGCQRNMVQSTGIRASVAFEAGGLSYTADVSELMSGRYHSTEPSIAQVSATGMVHGISSGHTTIVASGPFGQQLGSTSLEVNTTHTVEVSSLELVVLSGLQLRVATPSSTAVTGSPIGLTVEAVTSQLRFEGDGTDVIASVVLTDGARLDVSNHAGFDLSTLVPLALTVSRNRGAWRLIVPPGAVAAEGPLIQGRFTANPDCSAQILAVSHACLQVQPPSAVGIVIRTGVEWLVPTGGVEEDAGFSSSTSLQVTLEFSDRTYPNVASDTRAVYTYSWIQGGVDLFQVSDDGSEIIANSDGRSGVGLLSVTFLGQPVHANTTISVSKLAAIDLWATPEPSYPRSDEVIVDTLSRIAPTSPVTYEMARLQMHLRLENTATREIVGTSRYVAHADRPAADISTIGADGVLSVTAPGSFTVQGWFQNYQSSNNITLTATVDPVTVRSIDAVHLLQDRAAALNTALQTFAGPVGSRAFVEASVTFSNGRVAPRLFDNEGLARYPGLVTFITNTQTSVAVNQVTGVATLLDNHWTQGSILVAPVGNDVNFTAVLFACNLDPELSGDVDLGDEGGIPVPSQQVGGVFDVDVFVNTGGNTLGSYDVVVSFDVDMVEVNRVRSNVNLGSSTALGFLVRPGLVRFSGPVFPSSVRGIRESIATIDFRAIGAGLTRIAATVLRLEDVSTPSMTFARNQTAVAGAITVLVRAAGRKRRFFAHELDVATIELPYPKLVHATWPAPRRRQTDSTELCRVPGDTDYNCEFTVGDVLFILMYIAARGQNFETTNGLGSAVRQVLHSSHTAIFEMDADGNHEINTKDATFLNDINLGKFYFVRETRLERLRDEGVCGATNGLVASANVLVPAAWLSEFELYFIVTSPDPTFQQQFDQGTFPSGALATADVGVGTGVYGGAVLAEPIGGGDSFGIFTANITGDFGQLQMVGVSIVQITRSMDGVHQRLLNGAEYGVPFSFGPLITAFDAFATVPVSIRSSGSRGHNALLTSELHGSCPTPTTLPQSTVVSCDAHIDSSSNCATFHDLGLCAWESVQVGCGSTCCRSDDTLPPTSAPSTTASTSTTSTWTTTTGCHPDAADANTNCAAFLAVGVCDWEEVQAACQTTCCGITSTIPPSTTLAPTELTTPVTTSTPTLTTSLPSTTPTPVTTLTTTPTQTPTLTTSLPSTTTPTPVTTLTTTPSVDTSRPSITPTPGTSTPPPTAVPSTTLPTTLPTTPPTTSQPTPSPLPAVPCDYEALKVLIYIDNSDSRYINMRSQLAMAIFLVDSTIGDSTFTIGVTFTSGEEIFPMQRSAPWMIETLQSLDFTAISQHTVSLEDISRRIVFFGSQPTRITVFAMNDGMAEGAGSTIGRMNSIGFLSSIHLAVFRNPADPAPAFSINTEGISFWAPETPLNYLLDQFIYPCLTTPTSTATSTATSTLPTTPSTTATTTPSTSATTTPTTTASPTAMPSTPPTHEPSHSPSVPPTANPSAAPTSLPTRLPSSSPTAQPTVSPSTSPTFDPCLRHTCSMDCVDVHIERSRRSIQREPDSIADQNEREDSGSGSDDGESGSGSGDGESESDDSRSSDEIDESNDDDHDHDDTDEPRPGSIAINGSDPANIRFSCGWDSEFNLCRTGFRTSPEEAQRLLETTSGDCSHHTLSPTTSQPTASPTLLPSSSSPTATPTQAPTDTTTATSTPSTTQTTSFTTTLTTTLTTTSSTTPTTTISTTHTTTPTTTPTSSVTTTPTTSVTTTPTTSLTTTPTTSTATTTATSTRTSTPSTSATTTATTSPMTTATTTATTTSTTTWTTSETSTETSTLTSTPRTTATSTPTSTVTSTLTTSGTSTPSTTSTSTATSSGTSTPTTSASTTRSTTGTATPTTTATTTATTSATTSVTTTGTSTYTVSDGCFHPNQRSTPTLLRELADEVVTATIDAGYLAYTLPNDTFWDEEPDELLLEVTGMPDWLSFDTASQTFVGVPLRSTTGFPDVVDVKITANKGCLLSNTTSLSISVDALIEEDPTLILEMKWLISLPQVQSRRRNIVSGEPESDDSSSSGDGDDDADGPLPRSMSNCANEVDGFVRASILEAVAAQANVSVTSLSFDIIDAIIVLSATQGSICQCSVIVTENGPITCADARAAKEAIEGEEAAMARFVAFEATFSTSLPLGRIVLDELVVNVHDNCSVVALSAASDSGAAFDFMPLMVALAAVAGLVLCIAGIVYRRREGAAKDGADPLFLPRPPTVLGSEQRLAWHELQEARRPVALHDDGVHDQRVPLEGEIPYLAQGPGLGRQKGSTPFLGPLRQPPTYRLPPAYTGPHRKRFDGLADIELGSNIKMMVTEITTTTTTTRHGHAPAYWSPPDYRHNIHSPGTPVAPSPEAQRHPPPPFVHPPEYLSEHDAEADPLDQPRHPDPLKKKLMTAAEQLSTEVSGGVKALEDQIATTGDPNADLENPFMELDSITNFGHSTFSLAHTLSHVGSADLEGGFDHFHDGDLAAEGDAAS